jgi:hypothetical protein
MQNINKSTTDFVIGIPGSAVASENVSERQTATIENMVRNELIAIWQRDELPLDVVLDKVEELEKHGWMKVLEWLGHFYMWDSFQYLWDMTYVKEAWERHCDDFVLGMTMFGRMKPESAHAGHEKMLRSLMTAHWVAGWKCGDYELERAFEMFEDMDTHGALNAWIFFSANAETDG